MKQRDLSDAAAGASVAVVRLGRARPGPQFRGVGSHFSAPPRPSGDVAGDPSPMRRQTRNHQSSTGTPFRRESLELQTRLRRVLIALDGPQLSPRGYMNYPQTGGPPGDIYEQLAEVALSSVSDVRS